MTKLTLDQKKLHQIKNQLYGKTPTQAPKTNQHHSSTPSQTTPSTKEDAQYLKQDLLKIFVISAVVVVIQVSFYLAVQNNLIRLF